MKYKSMLKYGSIGVFLTLIGYAYLFTPLNTVFSIENMQEFVTGFGMFAPLVFILVYVIAMVFFLPATIFAVLGGVLFGTWWGTLYVIIAATIAAEIGFRIGKKIRGNKDREIKNKFIKKFVDKGHELCEKRGFETFFIIRLLFLPYMGISYAAGMIKTAKRKDFMLATLSTNVILSFVYVFFGSQIQFGWKSLVVPAILIVFTLFLPTIVRKVKRSTPFEE